MRTSRMVTADTIQVVPNSSNENYLKTKKEKLGHLLSLA